MSADELAGSLVINTDVIEHLPDPHKLLAQLRAAGLNERCKAGPSQWGTTLADITPGSPRSPSAA